MAAIKFNSKPMTAAETSIQQYIADNFEPGELESVHMLSDRRALVCLSTGRAFHLVYGAHGLSRVELDLED